MRLTIIIPDTDDRLIEEKSLLARTAALAIPTIDSRNQNVGDWGSLEYRWGRDECCPTDVRVEYEITSDGYTLHPSFINAESETEKEEETARRPSHRRLS